MSVEPFFIECPYAVSLRHTVRSHGWIQLSPWTWNEEAGVLARPDRLPSEGRAWIQVTQKSPRSFWVAVEAKQPQSVELEQVKDVVSRWLSLTWNPTPSIEVVTWLSPAITSFIMDGGGRFLRSSTFYEDFVKTVCTIQISWSGTRRMVMSLVDEIGDGLFPTPRQVLDAGETDLRKRVRLGFRARQLFEATEKLLEWGLMDELGRESESPITYEELIRLRGIGPYAASHVMVLLHDFSRIPIDSEVTRYYGERYGLAPAQIEPFFDRWGDYRFLVHRLSTRLDLQLLPNC